MKEKHISVDEDLHKRVKDVAEKDNRSMRGWIKKKVEEDENKGK